MSFPKYPVYKDSGVEWLGEVPEHWQISRIKYVADINMGQSPSSDDCNTEGIGLPFLQGNAEFGDKHPTPTQYCPVAKKVAEAGDLLFSVRAPVGALNEANQAYGIGRGLCALRPGRGTSKEFLWWVLSTSQSLLDSISTGSTFEAVSAEQVENIPVAVPLEASEQTQIARFLDHETARIDALIEEQQRLIELLKEKRQAVISHAVTKGLDPTVPMKDSGVEWLGEVPEHWVRGSLKNMAWIRNGKDHKEVESSDGAYPVIGSGGQFSNANDYLHDGESVLLGRKGTIDKPLYINGRFWTVDTMFYTEVSKDASAKFLYYFALTIPFGFYSTSTALPSMTQGDLLNHPVAIPPMLEQTQIAHFLDHETARIDALVDQATTVVGLLQERRSALISAAVTGKIDVRNWQPTASAQAPEAEQEAV